jgi:hypothetical protein
MIDPSLNVPSWKNDNYLSNKKTSLILLASVRTAIRFLALTVPWRSAVENNLLILLQLC